MKKILTILICFIAVVACSKEDYITYDTGQKDGVFLPYTNVTDSVFYNFGFDYKTEYTFPVKINLVGMPKSYDRHVKLVAVPSKYASDEFIAAKDSWYELPSEFIFPKDSVTATIPVVLKRDVELENLRAILTFVIEESDDLSIRGHNEFTITFDDKSPALPGWWQTFNYGAFTKEKGQIFFKYFWEMETENVYLFNKIVSRWGRNLDIAPNTYGDNPLVVYTYAFTAYVQQKMYDDDQSDASLGWGISKPNYY